MSTSNRNDLMLLKTIKRLQEQNAMLLAANARLAEINVSASESIVDLEDEDARRSAMTDALAGANAHSAELICELELQAEALRDALERVRVLQGLISICMHCRKLRDGDTDWSALENYMEKHSDAHFTHGVCPTCLDEHYPED